MVKPILKYEHAKFSTGRYLTLMYSDCKSVVAVERNGAYNFSTNMT